MNLRSIADTCQVGQVVHRREASALYGGTATMTTAGVSVMSVSGLLRVHMEDQQQVSRVITHQGMRKADCWKP